MTIPQEKEEPHLIVHQRGSIHEWFSAGNIITLIGAIIVSSVAVGSLSREVTRLQEDMRELRTEIRTLSNRDITPGASSRLSAVEARMDAYERNQDAVVDALQRIETKLDAHMEGRGHAKQN